MKKIKALIPDLHAFLAKEDFTGTKLDTVPIADPPNIEQIKIIIPSALYNLEAKVSVSLIL